MSKRLTDSDTEKMKQMVVNGVAPEDIAKYFNIAVSSVHNYKQKFKAEGLNFPSVRGKRPAGDIKPVGERQTAKIKKEAITSFKESNYTFPEESQTSKSDRLPFKFIVNGIIVQISGEAQTVTINKDSIEVNF